MSITRLPVNQPRPGDPSPTAVEEIYQLATGRDDTSRVDCACCDQRHERFALTWFQFEDGWLVAPICACCETLDYDRIEHQITHRQQPPLRRIWARRGNQTVVFYVADPDFSRDRRS